MPSRPLALSVHAEDALRERKIQEEWVARTVEAPDWREVDPSRPGTERRFRRIPEFGDRVLRVAVVETPTEIRILTAFFDRKAKRP